MRESEPKHVDLKQVANLANSVTTNLWPNTQIKNHTKWTGAKADVANIKKQNPTECDLEFLNWIKLKNQQTSLNTPAEKVPEKDKASFTEKRRDSLSDSHRMIFEKEDEEKYGITEDRKLELLA